MYTENSWSSGSTSSS